MLVSVENAFRVIIIGWYVWWFVRGRLVTVVRGWGIRDDRFAAMSANVIALFAEWLVLRDEYLARPRNAALFYLVAGVIFVCVPLALAVIYRRIHDGPKRTIASHARPTTRHR